jgi:hypothetical protein
MIPAELKRKHLIKAISFLNSNPSLKKPLRRYYIQFNGDQYSPKQVISIACKYLNGKGLSSTKFNGGKESNLFLQKLGFNVLSIEISIPTTICAALIQQEKKQSNKQRLSFLKELINALPERANILLLPGGFFSTNKKSDTLYKWVASEVSILIQRKNLFVVLGIDGRYQKDQIAIALNENGIVALGRKFYPVKVLEDYIQKANHHMEMENEFPRIFKIHGKTFYLAVCFDTYGIRHLEIPNPNIHAILNLIHEFHPKGEKRSGDSYFAKYGLAGSSRQWNCPTFGSTVFCKREIPEKWPCGVVYKQDQKILKEWRYKRNGIRSSNEFYFKGSSEKALLKMYLT